MIALFNCAALCCCFFQTKDPVLFVKLLLEMRDKYETTIVHAFVDDKTFKNTLNSVRYLLHRSQSPW